MPTINDVLGIEENHEIGGYISNIIIAMETSDERMMTEETWYLTHALLDIHMSEKVYSRDEEALVLHELLEDLFLKIMEYRDNQE